MTHFDPLSPLTAELLTIVAEEAAEVSQAACKALRHGLQSQNPYRPEDGSNATQIVNELLQLLAVVNELQKLGKLPTVPATAELFEQIMSRKRMYMHHDLEAPCT